MYTQQLLCETRSPTRQRGSKLSTCRCFDPCARMQQSSALLRDSAWHGMAWRGIFFAQGE